MKKIYVEPVCQLNWISEKEDLLTTSGFGETLKWGDTPDEDVIYGA